MSTTTNDFYATSSFETQATFDATQQLEAYLKNEFDPGFRNFLNDLPELNGVSYTDGDGMEVTYVTSSIEGTSAYVNFLRLLSIEVKLIFDPTITSIILILYTQICRVLLKPPTILATMSDPTLLLIMQADLFRLTTFP